MLMTSTEHACNWHAIKIPPFFWQLPILRISRLSSCFELSRSGIRSREYPFICKLKSVSDASLHATIDYKARPHLPQPALRLAWLPSLAVTISCQSAVSDI